MERQQRSAFLSGYANFDNQFLTEADMLTTAADQYHLLSLYKDWDARMEAATVHLAAPVGKPVIVYDEMQLERTSAEIRLRYCCFTE